MRSLKKDFVLEFVLHLRLLQSVADPGFSVGGANPQFCQIFWKRYMKQECIPVGCVPPAAVAIWGGLHQTPPWTRPPRTRHTPRPGTRHTPSLQPGTPPFPWTDTPVNILPCPKFRFRAVISLVRNDPPMITSDKLSSIYFKQAYEIVILPLSRYL